MKKYFMHISISNVLIFFFHVLVFQVSVKFSAADHLLRFERKKNTFFMKISKNTRSAIISIRGSRRWRRGCDEARIAQSFNEIDFAPLPHRSTRPYNVTNSDAPYSC